MILPASSCPRATQWEHGSHGKPHFQQEVLHPQMSVLDCSNIQEWRLLPFNCCGCTLGTKSCFRNSGIKLTTPSYCLTPRGFLICCWNTPRAHSAVIGQSCGLFHVREKRITSVPPLLAAQHGKMELLYSLWNKSSTEWRMNEWRTTTTETVPFCFFKGHFFFKENKLRFKK